MTQNGTTLQGITQGSEVNETLKRHGKALRFSGRCGTENWKIYWWKGKYKVYGCNDNKYNDNS